MANFVLQHACLLILLTSCVDLGDGRWKKTGRDTLKYDLKLYKKLSEKFTQDVVAVYDDYPNDELLDYYLDEFNYLQKQINHDLNLKRNSKKYNTNNMFDVKIKSESDNKYNNNLTIFNPRTNKIGLNKSQFKWPKFEDILLAMGKKYDWKNDRWIKIKKKIIVKVENKINNEKKNEEFTQKHKFIYKIVKLNRAKSKRNIVIAVTAVR